MPSPTLTASATPVDTKRVSVKNTRTTEGCRERGRSEAFGDHVRSAGRIEIRADEPQPGGGHGAEERTEGGEYADR